MGKQLSEMSLEELWELFPIILTKHRKCWEEWYQTEKEELESFLSGCNCKIQHIGSTAIAGIMAKPIIDILVEIPKYDCGGDLNNCRVAGELSGSFMGNKNGVDTSTGNLFDIKDNAIQPDTWDTNNRIAIFRAAGMDQVGELLQKHGYLCMSEEENRKSFNKGYTINGFAEKVFHLHLRYYGDNDELYFRDYMKENPTIATEYEELKIALWHQYEHNRNAYTEAKTDFIIQYTDVAKEIYGNRYA